MLAEILRKPCCKSATEKVCTSESFSPSAGYSVKWAIKFSSIKRLKMNIWFVTKCIHCTVLKSKSSERCTPIKIWWYLYVFAESKHNAVGFSSMQRAINWVSVSQNSRYQFTSHTPSSRIVYGGPEPPHRMKSVGSAFVCVCVATNMKFSMENFIVYVQKCIGF